MNFKLSGAIRTSLKGRTLTKFIMNNKTLKYLFLQASYGSFKYHGGIRYFYTGYAFDAKVLAEILYTK
jgi:hypothetical protein